ncbi:9493_t:CDS:2 [Diversispora eburnea]|uniref:9493_t:CDS:1 n=1 Tax=Diversispora eburnea TaxID=1213867 RepID=A0A9N8UZQ5_9GLOM|nr:9493_t:CDS:2 [Diversispora eburnea]
MDQETAHILFNQGAFLLFLNAPRGLEFGIDYNTWEIGPKFKGIKFIPPGLHFVYYSTKDKFGGISGLRNGFFKFYESKEVLIKEWDTSKENLKEEDPEQYEVIKSDMREWDQYLGPYPLTPPKNWKKWVQLTNLITPWLINKVFPHKGKVSNASSSTVDEEELQNIGTNFEEENTIMFTKFDIKKSWRPGAVGQEVTKYSQDKSWLLEDLLKRIYKNDYKELLGELQLSFVCLLMAQNFAGFYQWKNIVQLICSSKESIYIYSDTLFMAFLDVLMFQLEECPQDFFHDVISENNFLSVMLKIFHKNVKERFSWEVGDRNFEDEKEEGEFAPVVVEFPQEQENEIEYITEFGSDDTS